MTLHPDVVRYVLRDYVDDLNRVGWDTVVVDEVHKIKEPNAKVTKALKELRSRRRIGLTGTLLQNKSGSHLRSLRTNLNLTKCSGTTSCGASWTGRSRGGWGRCTASLIDSPSEI